MNERGKKITRRALLGLAAAAAAAPFIISALPRKFGGTRQFRGEWFDVLEVNLSRHRVELLWRDENGQPLRSMEKAIRYLERRGEKPVALTNAGIFNLDFTPAGLHLSDGVVLAPLNEGSGDGNFFLKPNGVFLIDDEGAAIVETSEFRSRSHVKLATQSGPLLVRHGHLHPAFQPGSGNKKLRSGVGVAASDRIYFALSSGMVNFETFAELFRSELRCPDALFLDGDISRLWAPSMGLEALDTGPFTGMLAVVDR
ncbi:MAG: phosphodiester glycosidase family protein [Myxococcaceae bacterium]